MPHPKNRLKLTGDTHAPEVAYDMDDERDDPAVRYADGYEPPRDRREASDEDAPDSGTAAAQPQPDHLEAAREQVKRSPIKMIGIALAVGFVLARVLR